MRVYETVYNVIRALESVRREERQVHRGFCWRILLEEKKVRGEWWGVTSVGCGLRVTRAACKGSGESGSGAASKRVVS